MSRYPRNMRGYGADVPDANWPGGAKIAVQFVVNYEEGGENCVLHGDNASEAFLSEIVGAAPWEGQRHEQVAAMQDANWEIASHGLKWIEYKDFEPHHENYHIQQAKALHTEVTGDAPRGWYTGRCSVNTVDLITKDGSFDYISDTYDDDLPYWYQKGGQDQLVIPYTLDANDMRFATPQGFNSGDQFFAYLKDSFDALYEEGCDGTPKMMSIGLHCRLAGRPGRVQAVKKFIEYAKSHADVWFAKRIEIADHWRKHHPAPEVMGLPTKMSRAGFVDKFGGVFEHSPWIAERAFDAELGPAHNSAVGLHNAMARQFRKSSQEERLNVLKAHPDLAGKLATAKRLTAESTAEQAGAGLDALTKEEHDEFTHLNLEYTKKHGFPFIVAVKGLTKEHIVAQFKARVLNTRDAEFKTACKQVERIALLRLTEILP